MSLRATRNSVEIAHEHGRRHAPLDHVLAARAADHQVEVLGAHHDQDAVPGLGRFRQQALDHARGGLDIAELGAVGRAPHDALDEIGQPDEVGDEAHARPAVNLHRPALLHDPALIHDRDHVGHGQRLELVVGDIDGGDAEALHQVADLGTGLLAQLGVEVRERLVEQQDRRLAHQRARQRQALLLAARQERRGTVLEARQLHQLERLHHLVTDLLAVEPPLHLAQRERHVLEHVHVRPDGVGLEHHADVALVGRHHDMLLVRKDELVIDDDLAGGRPLETRETTQCRGLAAPRRPQHGVELAVLDLDVDPTHRVNAAFSAHIVNVQIPDLDHQTPRLN